MRRIPIPSFLRSWWAHSRRFDRIAVVAAVAAILIYAPLLAGWYAACGHGACPSLDRLTGWSPDESSQVYDRNGRVIATYGTEWRRVVPLDQIPPAVREAFVATEDKRFYRHHGVDYLRVLGAVKADLFAGGLVQGFSTITMQLARNLWPDDINGYDRSLSRKIREMQMAWEIERRYPKQRILELYLNQIPLGDRVFGVEAAARRYFGKPVTDLNPAEAATLAALPKAPNTYNPRRHPRLALARRNVVLGLMRDAGFLSAGQAREWRRAPLSLTDRAENADIAPYFVEHVRRQLEPQYGDRLYRGGLRIYTTLDLTAQRAAERSLEQQLERIESGALGRYPRASYRAIRERDDTAAAAGGATSYLQGLVVSIDPRTGGIRALVGGRDFEDSKFNRVTQARRQAGSTFKPFVYAAAVHSGIPLSRLVSDSPLTVAPAPGDSEPWSPHNFGEMGDDPVTVRQAIYRSVNLVAVRIGMEVGTSVVREEARHFGISTPIPPFPSIFIGSASVVPLQLVAAYTAFATDGVRAVPYAVTRVEDRAGHVLYQAKPDTIRVLTPAETWLLRSAMQDVVRRGTAYSAVTGAGFRGLAAGKTGTTDDFADAWFVGFTPTLVTGTWIGMDLPQRIMGNAQGGRLAAPVWTSMMRQVGDTASASDWSAPSGLTFASIDRTTGYLATPDCPGDSVYTEAFLPGTQPIFYCPVHGPNLRLRSVDFVGPREP